MIYCALLGARTEGVERTSTRCLFELCWASCAHSVHLTVRLVAQRTGLWWSPGWRADERSSGLARVGARAGLVGARTDGASEPGVLSPAAVGAPAPACAHSRPISHAQLVCAEAEAGQVVEMSASGLAEGCVRVGADSPTGRSDRRGRWRRRVPCPRSAHSIQRFYARRACRVVPKARRGAWGRGQCSPGLLHY